MNLAPTGLGIKNQYCLSMGRNLFSRWQRETTVKCKMLTSCDVLVLQRRAGLEAEQGLFLLTESETRSAPLLLLWRCPCFNLPWAQTKWPYRDPATDFYKVTEGWGSQRATDGKDYSCDCKNRGKDKTQVKEQETSLFKVNKISSLATAGKQLILQHSRCCW